MTFEQVVFTAAFTLLGCLIANAMKVRAPALVLMVAAIGFAGVMLSRTLPVVMLGDMTSLLIVGSSLMLLTTYNKTILAKLKIWHIGIMALLGILPFGVVGFLYRSHRSIVLITGSLIVTQLVIYGVVTLKLQKRKPISDTHR